MNTSHLRLKRRIFARAMVALAVLAVFSGLCLWLISGGPAVRDPGLTVPPSASEDHKPPASPPAPPVSEAGPGRDRPAWDGLILRLAADGFDKAHLETIFANLGVPPLPGFMGQKAVELYARHGKARLLASDNAPSDFAPPDYTRAAGGVTAAAGRRAIASNKRFFESLYKRYGVPAPFVVAVLMVETGLGAELGKQPALLALGSMAVMPSLEHVLPVVEGIPPDHRGLDEQIRARSDWAYEELKALIAYAKASGKEAWSIPGSVFGAIGICQFMPSNIERLGVSSDGKLPVPDVFAFTDAAASVARYLAAHGWKNAQTTEAKIAVLRAYNHSDIYASTVYGVANALMTPTTHAAAESARQGRNAVSAARETARAAKPGGRGKALGELDDYSKLLD